MTELKKKVGLVTIHDIYNYGSVLQAYATQKVIESFGYDVEIIDYKYPNKYHSSKINPLIKLKGKLFFIINSLLKDLLPGRKYQQYVKNYKYFKQKNYKLSTNSYKSIEEIKAKPPQYDIYISGSDQIWRAEFVKFDECFLLNFVQNVKKISYASSFGANDVPNEYKNRFSATLNQYNHIGVRESRGVDIVKELTGKDATLVLDPTLLLNKEDWEKVLVEYNSETPYILCYGQNMGDGYMEKLAKHLKRTAYKDHKIVRINGKFYDYFNKEMEFILDAGPAEFLGLFKNASLVLAQSFHATVFSIIFEKKFISILRGDSNHDSRQIQILTLLGLEDRIIYIGDSLSKCSLFVENINYAKVGELLDNERDISFSFIEKSLCS